MNTPIEAVGQINSLTDLINVVSSLRELKGHTELKSEPEKTFRDQLKASCYGQRGKSLDLWFRGQGNSSHSLVPGAFRHSMIGDDNNDRFYEETSASYHFMLRHPDHRTHCSTNFEWLSLLQHYGGSTRLLDWSENAMIAAFFAVYDAKKTNASIYVLNASLLNKETMLVAHDIPKNDGSKITKQQHLGICIDTSPDVLLRSTQAFSRSDSEWRSYVDSVIRSGTAPNVNYRWLIEALDLLDEYIDPEEKQSDKRHDLAKLFYKKLTYPVAVFPQRSNARIIAQSGLFTIHGGKGMVNLNVEDASNTLKTARPTQIEELATSEENKANQWLLRYEIPEAAKQTIRDQLEAIGVHRFSLFPEIQSDGEIMKDLWYG
jgi:hypothetical protein